MSFFGVTIEKAGSVTEVFYTDNLDVVKPEGKDIQGVVGRGSIKQGDEFLMFPLNAIIPEPILVTMNLSGKLSGKEKNRVSTRTLRGVLSQCLIAPLSLIDGLTERTPEAITAYLGVTKYEPDEIPCHGGVLMPLPPFCSTYDIESCDRYEVVASKLMDLPAYITEKLEGTNFSITYDVREDKVYVNQRNNTIVENEKENGFWRTAREMDLTNKIKELAKHFNATESVSLYGERIGPGIQSNLYELKQSVVRAFDIKVDGRWRNASDFLTACNVIKVETVPILNIGDTLRVWLAGKTIKQASTGASILNHGIYREGIVIKPCIEQFEYELSGRLILKQHSPEYFMADKSKKIKVAST